MDKIRLIKNFSRSASFYDRYANVQRNCATELLRRLTQVRFNKILELGCGTGNYCSLLREKFSEAQLTAVDISEPMIAVARNKLKGSKINFVVADAEDASFGEGFDLVTSNACFQWFEDLERSLIRYKEMLENKGLILFSLFGPLTFRELNVSLGDLFKSVSVRATRFATKETIESLLKKHFVDVLVEEKFYEEAFEELGSLLEKIKYTGTAGFGFKEKVFLGPRRLENLETAYLERFGRIRATSHVFFCRGRKQ